MFHLPKKKKKMAGFQKRGSRKKKNILEANLVGRQQGEKEGEKSGGGKSGKKKLEVGEPGAKSPPAPVFCVKKRSPIRGEGRHATQQISQKEPEKRSRGGHQPKNSVLSRQRASSGREEWGAEKEVSGGGGGFGKRKDGPE